MNKGSVGIVEYEPIVRGPQGPNGDPGVPGVKGTDGIDGDHGFDGRDGRDGKDGNHGKPGAIGRSGQDGKNGKDGSKGKPGQKGAPGVHGKKGKDGDIGRAGIDSDIRNLSEIDLAFLKDNLVGNVVDTFAVNDNDEKTIFTIGYTKAKDQTFEVLKPRPGVVRVSGGVGGNSNNTGEGEGSILYMASIAPSTATYTVDKITLLTYGDFQGITGHTKSLTYTGSELTSTEEVFEYKSQTWTVDVGLIYSAGVWQSKTISISKV